jgi:hypothetical protein
VAELTRIKDMLAAILALLDPEFTLFQVVFIDLHGPGICYFIAAVFQYNFLNFRVET